MTTFRVTISARARHGILWALVKKYPSQKDLAAQLGISPHDLGEIINLKKIPDINSSRFIKNKKWSRASEKLVKLTGRSLEEIFPPAMAGRKIKNQFEETREVPVQQLLGGGRISFFLPERDEDET